MQARIRHAFLTALFGLFAAAPHAYAQERGAIALGELVAGLGVNARVLMIGAHPDDEDTNLITWLQRGRYVETAYLSLTRGDGGQNLIGNELGEALGVIRTEELLAARRIDGARQYFTRAFDFGFSKDTIDTFRHWQRDSILRDVVRVVRHFRPHVIVAVFSGTSRDGHGHHQVSGLLARAAYDVSADTVRFPTEILGPAWTVAKFYRAARGNQQSGTLAMDVGEYSPLLGRSFGEIAGESRSQHRSQGFGALQRKGPIMNYVRRDASRVNEASPATAETGLFDGIDTSWARFRDVTEPPRRRRTLDSIPLAIAAIRAAYDPFDPGKLLAPLSRLSLLLTSVCEGSHERCLNAQGSTTLWHDLFTSKNVASGRIQRAKVLAAGVVAEATARRELAASGDSLRVELTVYNRGRDTVWRIPNAAAGERNGPEFAIAPGASFRDTLFRSASMVLEPWWLSYQGPYPPRTGSMFLSGSIGAEDRLFQGISMDVLARASSQSYFNAWTPVEFRFADAIRGEVRYPVAVVPAVSVSLGAQVYAPAGKPFDRTVEVHLLSASDSAREARVTLSLPQGLRTDSASRTVRLDGYGAERTVSFRITGTLAAGAHRLSASVVSNGSTFRLGYSTIDYEHIGRHRIYRPASTTVSTLDLTVPSFLRVAYVAGVGDNMPLAIAQLGIAASVVSAAELARADLNAYTAVVIGPRAYEANPDLAASNPKLFDFARNGGTVVVQYGQYEMMQPGMTPFPITISRPHDRVTLEDAPVTILEPTARELTWPNKITDADFAGWVQERGLYMPRTFDASYRALFAMNDPGENPIRGGVLVAPMGKGKYIYTSLAFFRQLPAGVPGAARLFVNLLSANLNPTAATP